MCSILNTYRCQNFRLAWSSCHICWCLSCKFLWKFCRNPESEHAFPAGMPFSAETEIFSRVYRNTFFRNDVSGQSCDVFKHGTYPSTGILLGCLVVSSYCFLRWCQCKFEKTAWHVVSYCFSYRPALYQYLTKQKLQSQNTTLCTICLSRCRIECPSKWQNLSY